ncbi:hypothetical protein [Photobacterium leiognathi]|uniref:hypothetical protein n=1 Tax=Photobacterium leiognathi TaxID=553611 RepID=UPI002981BF71|nr:hypothetical protein [Photobacterium leiognathi]
MNDYIFPKWRVVSSYLFLMILPLTGFVSLLLSLDINLSVYSFIKINISRFYVLFTIIFSFIFLLFYSKEKIKYFEVFYLIAFLFSIVSMFFIVINNDNIYSYNSNVLISGYQYNFPIIFYSLTLFFVGYFFDIKKIKSAIILIFISFIIIVYSNVNGSLLYDLNNINPDYRNNYLIWSDSFAISALLLISILNKKKRVFIYFLSLIVVYSLYSRTSFFLLIPIYIFIYKDLSKNMKIISFIILSCISILILYFIFNSDIMDYFSRYISALSGNDNSVSARSLLLHQGLIDIKNNFILGAYGYQTLQNIDTGGARWGAYIHSILSYYRQFGLFVFLCIAFMSIMSFITLVKVNKIKNKDSNEFFYVIFGFYILVSCFFSRSYIYYELFFLFGLTLSQLKKGH